MPPDDDDEGNGDDVLARPRAIRPIDAAAVHRICSGQVVLDLASWSWEPVAAKGGPSARSGHRMAVVRDRLLVFGGFFDNLREVKYYNDLHMFDLKLYKWTKITPQPGALAPPSDPDPDPDATPEP